MLDYFIFVIIKHSIKTKWYAFISLKLHKQHMYTFANKGAKVY